MTVYVDDMRAPYGRMIMCHMVADTEGELFEMANRIGVAARHYQGDHFDICLQSRRNALSFGAVEVTKRGAATIRMRFRNERRRLQSLAAGRTS